MSRCVFGAVAKTTGLELAGDSGRVLDISFKGSIKGNRPALAGPVAGVSNCAFRSGGGYGGGLADYGHG